MDYLDFISSRKGNISRLFDVRKTFYRSKKQDSSYFMDYKTYKEHEGRAPSKPEVFYMLKEAKRGEEHGTPAPRAPLYSPQTTQKISSTIRLEINKNSSPTPNSISKLGNLIKLL